MASSEDQTSETKVTSKFGDYLCQTLNCGKPANLQCPTCLKLGIKEQSHFCSQVMLKKT